MSVYILGLYQIITDQLLHPSPSTSFHLTLQKCLSLPIQICSQTGLGRIMESFYLQASLWMNLKVFFFDRNDSKMSLSCKGALCAERTYGGT